VPPPRFRTRLNELFGIEHPILCGGLMWLATHDYVAAVARAGAIGFITPRSYASAEEFRDGLRRCAEAAAGRPFGVNLYVSARPEANEALSAFLDIAIAEGVRFVETAGYNPAGFLPRIRDAGMTVVHKCTSVRHALAAERAGVDAVTILGMEAGGHPGMKLTGAMVQGAEAAAALKIPVILGGGMGTGRQLLAALALGCEGILLGSRMVVAGEIWAHDDYKRRIVAAGHDDTVIVMGRLRDNYRALDNATARAVAALEEDGITDFEAYRPLVQGANTRRAYETGDPDCGLMSVGQACSFADAIEPAATIIRRIVDEAAAAKARLDRLGA
jgi:NAD(P)H-dependent flavin oxidoreductase YrpB (nitropropane dioxygenase family)